MAHPCDNCVLRLEHEIMHEALCEWAGMDRERAMEDLNYLEGVHDFAQRALDALERSGECTSG